MPAPATAPPLPLPITNVPVTSLFKKLEIVGKGAYGSVHRGIHIPSGCVVALKIINLDTPDDDVGDIQREVALLSHLRGGEASNVTRYWGCWLEGPRVWIAMDFASGGSILTLMKAGKIEERFTAVVIREALIGLSYLHHSNIIHRDIKAANILLTSAGRILLCDFGVSALLPSTNSKRMTFVGTPYWMAPEVINASSSYDTRADIWSLGITVYEIATGLPPYAEHQALKALVLIPSNKPPRLPETAGSKDMRDFVATCLRELSVDRPPADELQKHRWIKAYAKVPVSSLKELIVRYKGWEDKGGVRSSIIGLDDESDVIDERWDSDTAEVSAWEFEGQTMRPQPGPLPSTDTDENAEGQESMPTPTMPANEFPAKQPPRSLRLLFEDAATIPPPPELVRSPPSRRRQPTPQPFLEGPRASSPESYNMQTARPLNFAFPARPAGGQAGSPAPIPESHPRAATPGRSATPASSTPSSPEIDKSSHSRSPKSRSSSPTPSSGGTLRKRRAATLESKSRGPSPAPSRSVMAPNFSFPAAPSQSQSPSPRPRAPSTPTPRPQEISTSAAPPRTLVPPVPPPLMRAHSATPYSAARSESMDSASGGASGLSRRPTLTRVGSVAVMETVPGSPNPASPAPPVPAMNLRPLLAVPKGLALKDKMTPPMPEFANENDFLPPSPTLGHHAFPSASKTSLTVSTSSARTSRKSSTSTAPTSPMPSPLPALSYPQESPSPSMPMPMGPRIRPLDYSMLATGEAVHAELARTVEQLKDWLSVVEGGLAAVLDLGGGWDAEDVNVVA